MYWFKYDAHLWFPDQRFHLCREWAAEKLWSSDYAFLDMYIRTCQRHPSPTLQLPSSSSSSANANVDADYSTQGQEEQGQEWKALEDAYGAIFGSAWIQSLVTEWARMRLYEVASTRAGFGVGHVRAGMGLRGGGGGYDERGAAHRRLVAANSQVKVPSPVASETG